MKKLKSNGDILDRISALPDSLILEILSFLGMRDVVRTTLLSKRWKYLWITIPCLLFKEKGNSVQIRNFVRRALALWRGGHIRKFSITFSSAYKSVASLSSDIDLWVQFAKERFVEELCICLSFRGALYRPPQCLYECSSLRKLFLSGCNLRIGGNVQWDRLNRLDLSQCLISKDVINKVLSSSLQLETFRLYHLLKYKNLSIRSSSLRRLLIYDRLLRYSRDYDSSHVLTICAPNLKEFVYFGKPYGNSLLTDVSSLTEVHLDGEVLCEILPAINHVVSVLFSDYRIESTIYKMLKFIKGMDSFSPLSNVKLLRIRSGLTELRQLVVLLKIFPKLKMLIVNWRRGGNCTMYYEANSFLKSKLSQLRRVEITWSSYDASIFQFIEILLKHGTMIKKMVIQRRVLEVVESEDMFLAKQKVVSLQRSFPKVELILYQQVVKLVL